MTRYHFTDFLCHAHHNLWSPASCKHTYALSLGAFFHSSPILSTAARDTNKHPNKQTAEADVTSEARLWFHLLSLICSRVPEVGFGAPSFMGRWSLCRSRGCLSRCLIKTCAGPCVTQSLDGSGLTGLLLGLGGLSGSTVLKTNTPKTIDLYYLRLSHVGDDSSTNLAVDVSLI